MAKLPIDNRLKVEKLIEDEVIQGKKRAYLGISQIGNECPRAIWYDFRFCSKNEYSARIERLFQRGHREEQVIIADLKKIGVVIHSDQAEVICGHGHIKGHIDGGGDNIPDAPKTTHLLEFKTVKEGRDTAKTKYHFYKLREVGVKEYNHTYYIQCQCYMYLKKWKRTLFIAVNKNNDDRHYERLRLVPAEAKEAIQRGEDIIFNDCPPLRFESYKCNWCNHKPVCLEGALPEKNCRTCQYCDMEDEGRWSCSITPVKNLFIVAQTWEIAGCDYYELLNTLNN
jgi:hypothetical protein